MTTSPTFGSEPGAARSQAFEQLHPAMQQWVWSQGWTSLHEAQERALEPILSGRDAIIAAATAAGKTEAAFLPICSTLASRRDETQARTAPHDPGRAEPGPAGVEVLYISPLKALINDQFDRLERMAGRCDIPVHRWHGDVPAAAKRRVLSQPSGILLITPESLEATFVNRGTQVRRLLDGLRYVVVDELHAFIGAARGAQLQSLLQRVELAVRRPVPRIGLSATLGDMRLAAAFLRPAHPDRVVTVVSDADARELKLQVRGYLDVAPDPPDEDALPVATAAIADHLFKHLRGTDNLVFANSRRDVELYAALLAERCEADRVPNEFLAHHGNLSKDEREVVEAKLKDPAAPVTAVCTSTLELGIDIGSVTSIAQVGPPPSVAALRQRLGRSGRRDDPAVLRAYITEPELDARSSPIDQLRPDLIQTIASVDLLLQRWVESPTDPGLNLSTLIQQAMSVIAQHGGATAAELYNALCVPGPFAGVTKRIFAQLLHNMAAADFIVQQRDGTLLHGLVGERVVNHYSFYTAFATPEEWQLFAGGRRLGSLPIDKFLEKSSLIIFAGRRWRVVGIDTDRKILELERARGGRPPNFGGELPLVDDRVRAQMVNVYSAESARPWISPSATELLAEARSVWIRFDLARQCVVEWGTDTIILPWRGDRAVETAALMLRRLGLEADRQGPALVVQNMPANETVSIALDAVNAAVPDAAVLASHIANAAVDKWDAILDDELLAIANAARRIDIPGGLDVLNLTARGPVNR